VIFRMKFGWTTFSLSNNCTRKFYWLGTRIYCVSIAKPTGMLNSSSILVSGLLFFFSRTKRNTLLIGHDL
jgi:hypothetical protein